MLEPLEAYFRLLTKWNATDQPDFAATRGPTDETFDRLLVEPLCASKQIPMESASVWFDLGSGGGSPAIPLKMARPSLRLTMIESKERKAAFLREAMRMLGLMDAHVMNARFEDAAADPNFFTLGNSLPFERSGQIRRFSTQQVICLQHRAAFCCFAQLTRRVQTRRAFPG